VERDADGIRKDGTLTNSKVTASRRRALATVLLLVATALAWTAVQAPTRVDAAGETIISTFYVPLFEDNARAALFGVNGGTGTALSSTTSITVGATGAIIYYDNWEDGYEATPNVKVQASTLVFGDGNTANGNAADYCVLAACAGDNLSAGAVLRLNNSNPSSIVPGSIATPRTTGIVVFDGRDKISSTDGLAVTHATWPTAINALHSEMAAAFDTSRWGISFRAPVGTDTPAQGAGAASFTYSGIEIMAREANTQVQIDRNNDGDFLDAGEVSTIGEGQTVYMNGGVLQGTRVLASKPVQTFMMTGRIGSNYENRSFQVFPTEGLVNDYIAPASTALAAAPLYATVLYLFNPQIFAIDVTVTTPSGPNTYNIPAGQTLNPAPSLPAGQAARVTSANTFAAVAGIGTRETTGNSQNYDWGYSLLPARVITDSLVVGWAPGSQNLAFAAYDPVWVTLLAPTTLFVDYDSDPTTGANVDPNGNRYDTAISVPVALTQLRITDTGDNDMTGAHLYTVDGVGVAAAYGEDPASGEVAFPGIDLGTTLFPACGALCIRKLATIAIDVDGDGLVDPGDTLRWSVEATNTDYYALVNPILFDTLPAGLTYVPGSTTVSVNAAPVVGVADDTVPPATSLFPYDEGGRQLNANIAVGGKVTAFFETVVDPNFAGTAAICNRAVVTSSRDIIGTSANGADTGCSPVDGLRITKVSNSGGNPVLPGQALQYTVVVSNQSSGTVTNAAVTDPLPAGLNWVSTSVTRPAPTVVTRADNFETVTFGGSTGTVPWAAPTWTETDPTGVGPGAGRIRIISNLSSNRLQFRSGALLNEGVSRLVGDLSTATAGTLSFVRRCNGIGTPDAVSVEMRPNASASFVPLAAFTNCTNAAFVTESFPIPAAQMGLTTELRFRVSAAFTSSGTDELFFDDVVVSANPRIVSTVAGAAPPNIFTLTDLLPGESATIVVNTTVQNPYTATDEITNTATVRSGNQIARAEVVDCVRCFDFGDDPTIYNGAGGLNPARARAVSPRSYYADTFQSLGYSGSTGTVPWAGTSWVEADTGGGGPTGGQVQNMIDGSTRSIRIGGAAATAINTNALSRVVGDLTSFSEISLGFEYRCSNLDATDVVELQIRATAVAAWVSLQSFVACSNATIYSSNQITLAPANYGTATEIRLVVTTAFEGGESFFFDDVQIRATATSATVGPRLGTAFDREVQGSGGASPYVAVPPAAPNGDNVGGSDDEDGVTVPSVDTNTMEIPIVVNDSSGGVSYVNGWLDWSNTGGFTADESIFDAARFISATNGLTVVGGTGQVPGPGTYTVTVSVPNLETNGSGYAIGSTVYSRFRVATVRTGVASPTGASADGEIEDFSTTLNTLPVSLAYFGSTRARGNVSVNWRTAQEIDNLGFNLYAQGANGTLTLLTPDLVLSKAPTSIEPQEYSLTVATRATQIWLEDISLDGVSEMHGPYRVGTAVGDPQAPAAIDWAAARRQVDAKQATERRIAANRARAASSKRRTAPATAAVGPVARLDVTLAGVQQVTYEQLLAAGIDLAGVASSSLAITDQTGPIQVEVVGGSTFGAGSALRFIGQPLDTLYSGTNVYRVHIDPTLARRVVTVGPTPPATTTTTPTSTTKPPPPRRRPTDGVDQATTEGRVPPTTTPSVTTSTTTPSSDSSLPSVASYTESATVEPNVNYSVTAPGDDPWYDRMLIAIDGAPGSASASLDVTNPIAGQPAVAAVELWGITRDDIVDDHHVRLTVNGVLVADARFDDNDALRLQGTVPADVLQPGANTLEVTLVGDNGVYVDIVAVDSWRLTYQRSTVAVDGRLDLSAAGVRIDVAGMPAGEVIGYRVAADGVVTKLAPVVAAGVAQVPATPTAQRYVFSAASSVRSPAVSPPRAPVDLLSGSADYLVITNGVLTSSLAPLLAYHQSLGRAVKVADVADIYEAYSGGVVDAKAIDAYVAAAVPALDVTWVLLVGADSVDYRDYDGDGSFSLLPSLYGATDFSITYAPIDPAYADINGDGTPDVALGRLPARTPAELTTMISKTLAYADAQPTQSLLLVSDQQDGLDFAAVNDTLEARFDGWDVSRADVDRGGVDAARATLTNAINGGVGVTMYLGHSSSQEWTEVGLFDVSGAQALTNSVPTVVVQFGCWNTYYVSPASDTLAHALLLSTSGGAAAVLGATTLTSAGNDVQLAGYVANYLATGNLTIGEVLLAAKKDLKLYAGGSIADVQLGFTILGDPGLPAGGTA